MNSRKGGGKSSVPSSSSSPKGKGIAPQYRHSDSNSPKNDQPNHNAALPNIDTVQDDEWQVYGKKSRNRSGNSATKQQGASNASPKARGPQDLMQRPSMASNGNNWNAQSVDPKKQNGRGNTRSQGSSGGWESSYMAPSPAIPPPLQQGWQWAARTGSSNPSQSTASEDTGNENETGGSVGEYFGSDTGRHPSDDEDLEVDSDDDLLNDDYDSDASQKSYETRKKNKWFKTLFEALDNLTIDQINETSRQWHCPACHSGPGSIDWFRGLQPLITHAKTKGTTRVKLHRELAELLDEEVQRRGACIIPAGEAFGKWKGLHSEKRDHEIVWPPMVIIMNTKLEKDENDKWTGMGNQELLDYFSSYEAVKPRHSYGPQGHRGMSILIFEGSVIGYLEAERLDKHFAEQGMHRDAWERRPALFYQGGKRQLYGYMASKDDMDIFNHHSQGKSKLKFEMRSYQQMVVGPMKKMSEDNQLLTYYKNKVSRQQQRSKALEETVGMMSKKLRIANEENRIVRQRTQTQHEENKEEMDSMEQFFKEQVALIHEGLEEKEDEFEKSFQEQREKAKQSNADSGSKEEREHRQEEVEKIIVTQSKDVEKFEAEREKLMLAHEKKMTELKRKYLEKEVELEKDFKDTLTLLMEKYVCRASEPSLKNG
ncbi:protein SUPPRESSOR OF GENE SILENCING 3 homolog [Tasmannia lanceolata]|uniref:protein SUPPRESSOR OF GENE SILENCING 3 homolog n=1 Tax=Tasmannia lanceolata TaxID=3420 RepID=UPI00406286B2